MSVAEDRAPRTSQGAWGCASPPPHGSQVLVGPLPQSPPLLAPTQSSSVWRRMGLSEQAPTSKAPRGMKEGSRMPPLHLSVSTGSSVCVWVHPWPFLVPLCIPGLLDISWRETQTLQRPFWDTCTLWFAFQCTQSPRVHLLAHPDPHSAPVALPRHHLASILSWCIT